MDEQSRGGVHTHILQDRSGLGLLQSTNRRLPRLVYPSRQTLKTFSEETNKTSDWHRALKQNFAPSSSLSQTQDILFISIGGYNLRDIHDRLEFGESREPGTKTRTGRRRDRSEKWPNSVELRHVIRSQKMSEIPIEYYHCGEDRQLAHL